MKIENISEHRIIWEEGGLLHRVAELETRVASLGFHNLAAPFQQSYNLEINAQIQAILDEILVALQDEIYEILQVIIDMFANLTLPTSEPADPGVGAIWFDDTNDWLCVYTGDGWKHANLTA